MADFPQSIPDFDDLSSSATLAQNQHTARHNKVHHEVVALADKVGVDGSTDPNSLDYKVQHMNAATKTYVDNQDASTLVAAQNYAVAQDVINLSAAHDYSDDLHDTLVTMIRDIAHPVGSLYFNADDSRNPAVYLGYGTWSRYAQGYAIVGQNNGDPDFGTAGSAVGTKTHWHWQTFGNDGSGIYMAVAGYASGIGAFGRTTVITVDRNTFGSGSRSTDGARFDGTGDGNTIQPSIPVYVWRRTG